MKCIIKVKNEEVEVPAWLLDVMLDTAEEILGDEIFYNESEKTQQESTKQMHELLQKLRQIRRIIRSEE